MTALVEDLLLLARLDAGRPLPVRADRSVTARRGRGQRRPGGRAATTTGGSSCPTSPRSCTATPQRLHQVLVNLLANARTHTPPGTTVTARVHRHRAVACCVEVAGRRARHPADLLPHVFERFARGDASRSRAAGSHRPRARHRAGRRGRARRRVTVDSVPGPHGVHRPSAGACRRVRRPAVRSRCPPAVDSQPQPQATTRRDRAVAECRSHANRLFSRQHLPAREHLPGRGTRRYAGARRRDPRLQRGERPRALRAPAARAPRRAPSRTPSASPSRTTPAPTARPQVAARLAAETPRGRVRPAGAEGPRAGAAHRLVARPTRRCSPTWTSTCPPTSTRCCRWSPR